MATSICLHCKRALGCSFLYGQNGKFDASRLVTPQSTRECYKFEEVGTREKNVREWGFAQFGLGYLRVLHELPELVMEGLRQGEEDELMYENIPDFQDQTLLWDGMTTAEREDVLRYQTDENGQIIIEIDSEGVEHRLARPEYHIKAYMCDPDGPIKAEKAVTWAWNINQVVDHILKTEAEAGLIVKTKKTRASKAKTAKEAPTTQEVSEEETDMTRVVRTVRSTAPKAGGAKAAAPKAPKAAAPKTTAPAKEEPEAPAQGAAPASRRVTPKTAGGGRVGTPPGRRAAAPAAARKEAAPTEEAAPAASGISLEDVEKVVQKVVDAKFKEIKELLEKGIETTIDCATILNDIAGQTGGTFQVPQADDDGNMLVDEEGNYMMMAPQLFPHPSKLYAYIEGTAYDPEWCGEAEEESEGEG